ncbi:MAG TPA: hypothetical protein VNF26_00620 [Candidatus Baltobacterales bacterium]|nr:hypothetical protein [Candidatus Baltobacterales bacterium]
MGRKSQAKKAASGNGSPSQRVGVMPPGVSIISAPINVGGSGNFVGAGIGLTSIKPTQEIKGAVLIGVDPKAKPLACPKCSRVLATGGAELRFHQMSLICPSCATPVPFS